MKRLLVVILSLFISAFSFADILSEPLASVNLIRPEMITSLEVDQKIELYNRQLRSSGMPAQNISRKEMLDSIISSILIAQAAERSGLTVSDIDLNRVIQSQKQSAEGQLRQKITDEQFKQLIINQTSSTWDEYLSEIKDQLLQQSFITQNKKNIFENIKVPGNEEIEIKYNENLQFFFNPEYVRVSMVFIPVLNKNVEKGTIANNKLEQAYLELKNGSIGFDNAVLIYSEEESIKYRGGDIGYVGRDNQNLKLQLGDDFFNKLFQLPLNDISKVLESNSGYHIVKITEKLDPKLLTLEDKITPDNPLLVKDYIKDGILQENQQKALSIALNEI
ncbi:MAG: peptidylprolyl isomerase, partial [Spirochaetales bacterium]|nr:peptidylprolyl isomerase [Spirochaetales bacterium]